MTDEECLARCQALARMAAEHRESPVGSLIVVAGEIIGEGVEAARENWGSPPVVEILETGSTPTTRPA